MSANDLSVGKATRPLAASTAYDPAALHGSYIRRVRAATAGNLVFTDGSGTSVTIALSAGETLDAEVRAISASTTITGYYQT